MFLRGIKRFHVAHIRTTYTSPGIKCYKRSNFVGLSGIRSFSATSNSNTTENISNSIPDISDAISSVDSTLAEVAVDTAAVLGWGPKFQVMNFIEYMHITADIPYWQSIIVVSLITRFFLIPVAIKSAQNAARLAFVRPVMQEVQNKFKNNPDSHNPIEQQKYQLEIQSIFTKHKVNPFRSILLPLMQLPIFLSFFMALRDMGTYFPGYMSGGAYWFVDLAAADATLILPILNGFTFLLMAEVGADGMPESDNKGQFKTGMRILAVAMVPLTMSMPQGLFVYWNVNNSFSLVQAIVFKSKWFKTAFGLPDPPKLEDQPPLKLINPFKVVSDFVSKEFNSDKNRAEVVDGSEPRGAPPPPVIAPPPITFKTRPKPADRTPKV